MADRPAARAGGGPGDRIAGAVVLAFALLLWFVVIPDQIDTVDYGWMRPQTPPGICTVAMGAFGLLLAVIPPRGGIAVDPGQVARLCALTVLIAAALWAMARFGFPRVAPPPALVLQLLLGERRWPWIVGAAAGAPLAFWLVVEGLLQRSLP